MEYHWKEGEGLVFDDMFVHGVENNGTGRRVVLYMDIERKFMPKWMVRLNEWLMDASMNSPYVKAANKLAEQVHDSSPKIHA
jgi:aspartyl/asparaginyl beta-hydroxylase (cupin superfamily)